MIDVRFFVIVEAECPVSLFPLPCHSSLPQKARTSIGLSAVFAAMPSLGQRRRPGDPRDRSDPGVACGIQCGLQDGDRRVSGDAEGAVFVAGVVVSGDFPGSPYKFGYRFALLEDQVSELTIDPIGTLAT